MNVKWLYICSDDPTGSSFASWSITEILPCKQYAYLYQVYAHLLLEVLCPEENLWSVLLKMRVTAVEDVAKIYFGCFYPKSSTSPVYWLALHSLVNKSCNYYSCKTSLRYFFFAHIQENFFYFLKLWGGGWGGGFSNLEPKEYIKVKTPE